VASRRSVIRSAKHIPGGARPTAAPQGIGGPAGGGAGNFGQLSPLTAQLATGGSQGPTWNYGYGGFLPRPVEDFTQGAFAPFSPILPVPVDSPPTDQTPRAEPRWWQYDVGWNLPVGTPGTEGIKLADFGTLKTLADLYSVARACIQLRKDEIRGLDWDIMPTKDAAKAMRGSDKKMRDFGQRRAEAIKFFKHPDPDFFSWSTWLGAVLEEVFVFDALALLLRPKWGKGTGKGLLGSDLDSLKLIDGPSIRPLLDMHGGTPRPPAPAYQQYLYGVPRTDLMTMITGKDIEQYEGLEGPAFMGDQLLYLPMTPRRWTPYGFAPIEQALIPVMSGLQKQGYQLDFFREGTVPAVYISPGGSNSNMTPNQLRELQDALNAIAGDVAYKHKIIVLPADSKVSPQKPAEIADQFDEIVMNQVCMAFGVQPMELGISPRVSTTTSPGASNQMAKASQSTQERKATKPTLQYLAHIFNVILQDICQQDDMQFTFEGLEEDEDEATQTGMLVTQIGAGLRSIDEAREELGLQPWGLPETQDPGWATGTGFVPLGQVTAGGQPAPGQQPTAQNPAGAQQAGQPEQPPAAGAAKPTGGPANPPKSGGTPAKKPSGGGSGSTPGHAAAQAADTESGTARAGGKKSDEAEVKKFDAGTAATRQARRERHLAAIETTTTDKLHQLVTAYKDNEITAPEATDQMVGILGDGYQNVMDAGSQDAVDDGLADQVVSMPGEANARAEQQRFWLVNLLKGVALGYAVNLLKNRLATYAASLSGAYNHAYGQTAKSSGKNYAITWELGATEHCKLCLDRAGQTYTFDTLPGWPGDGGFGGLCYGGPRCGCSLSYSENGQTLASAGNPGQADAGPYYSSQLATIQARRQNVLDARQDFVNSLPAGARARAMTRDQIAQELAALENAAIQQSGGYGGISVEWTDVPAAAIAELVPSAYKAINSELEALARHYRKGRAINTWEPKHITTSMLVSIEEDLGKGLDISQAIEVAKAMSRRVDINGQIQEVDVPDPTVDAIYPVAAGSGNRVFPAHDVTGTETSAGRISYPYPPEVPGSAYGGDPGGEPPRWAPPEGTSSGVNGTQDTRAFSTGGDIDFVYPLSRGIPPQAGSGPRGGAPEGPSVGSQQSPENTPPGGWRVRKDDNDEDDVLKYNPSQPRNAHGEWTSGGGSEGGSSDAGGAGGGSGVGAPVSGELKQGDRVYHPDHGHGTVAFSENGMTIVMHDSGQNQMYMAGSPEMTQLHHSTAEKPESEKPEEPDYENTSYDAVPKINPSEKLTPSERASLAGYLTESGNRAYNDSLRSGAAATSDHKSLDSAISKSTTVGNSTVYRGISMPKGMSLSVGDSFTDPAYVSTSTDREIAQEFANARSGLGSDTLADMKTFAGTPVVMAIKVPHGSSAARGDSYAREVILPRGQSYKVTGIRPDGTREVEITS